MKTVLSEITKEELESLVKESNTYKEVLEKMGYHNPVGSSYRNLKNKILKFGICTNHMSHYTKPNSFIRSHEEIFCINSKVTQSCLRRRVLNNNLIPYQCAVCGNTGEWNNKPLTLTLDHINGNRTDNRLENLQFICPNCDKQQDTYGSKNKIRYYKTFNINTRKLNKCKNCGKLIESRAKIMY